ncbi:MAG TPA: SRPBCC family protein [Micromonosporaceae bacterium]
MIDRPDRSEPTDRPGDLGDAAQPGAGEVTATVIVNAAAARVFTALTAWERQSDWIPFTRVRVVAGDGREGSVVRAVTTVGPAVLRDEMRVIRYDAPYEVRVVHYGQLLRGPGVLRCTPLERDRTQVVWHEWFHLPGGPVGRMAWPVLWPGSKFGLTQALRRFARLVEQGALP